MARIEYNPFGPSDWQAYAGAAPFADGTPPMIAYWEASGLVGIAVVGGGEVGATVEFIDAEGGQTGHFVLESGLTALLIEDTATPDDVRALPGAHDLLS